MATGLKTRIVYRKASEAPSDKTIDKHWAGDFDLLMKAKSIPSPFGTPNMVDTSTLEDEIETQEAGRRSANAMDIAAAFEKTKKDELIALDGVELEFLILYGSTGKGDLGIAAFKGKAIFAPGEATDGHLEGTASLTVTSVPVWIEDKYTVTVSEDAYGVPETITLAEKP